MADKQARDAAIKKASRQVVGGSGFVRRKGRTEQEAIEKVKRIRAGLEQGMADAGTAAGWYGFIGFEDVRFLIEVALSSPGPSQEAVAEQRALRDAATLIDLAPLPPHISEEEKARAYLAVAALSRPADREQAGVRFDAFSTDDWCDFLDNRRIDYSELHGDDLNARQLRKVWLRAARGKVGKRAGWLPSGQFTYGPGADGRDNDPNCAVAEPSRPDPASLTPEELQRHWAAWFMSQAVTRRVEILKGLWDLLPDSTYVEQATVSLRASHRVVPEAERLTAEQAAIVRMVLRNASPRLTDDNERVYGEALAVLRTIASSKEGGQ